MKKQLPKITFIRHGSESIKSTKTYLSELNNKYKLAVRNQLTNLPEEVATFRSREKQKSELPWVPIVDANFLTKYLPEAVADFLLLFTWNIEHPNERQKLQIKKLKKMLIYFTSAFGIVAIVLFTMAALMPQKFTFNFAKIQNCSFSPTFFPSLLSVRQQEAFRIYRPGDITSGHVNIFSSQICLKPDVSLMPLTNYSQAQYLKLPGIKLSKNISIETSKYPVIYSRIVNPSQLNRLSLIKPLNFKLAEPDGVFNYDISANNHLTACSKTLTSLSCSLTPLKLSYASKYQLNLVRVFNLKPVSSAYAEDIKTINATGVTQSSVTAGSTVYSILQQITIQTNKPLTSIQGISLSYNNQGKQTTVPLTSSFSGNVIKVNWREKLPRQTTYLLKINNVTASNLSQFEQAFILPFTVSGGPQVTSDSLPAFGAQSGQTITLTFDQPLLAGQNASNFAALTVNSSLFPANYSITGNQLLISPKGNYPVCANISLAINQSVESNYGISAGSIYNFTTKSHCYTTISIGNSVDGRPITGYKFGNGPSMVLFIAAMEGNEQNSASLLNQWIPDIDANPDKIPSYRTLVIIPVINPDGYAANSRLNAHGIDVNRNFPANNWQTQVTEPLGNGAETNDGGPFPLSEPESKALADYFQLNKPRLTITEHSHGGIVEANDAGDSITLGQKYAQLAGYKAIPTYEIGNFFNYSTTGAFEDWANDKIGLPVLEVELESPTINEYSRNLPALWAMVDVSE